MLPKIASDLGLFMARTLFRGSDLSMKARAAQGGSRAVRRQCRTLRHHREPGLHRSLFRRARSTATRRRSSIGIVAELRADRDLKVEAQQLKHMFAANAETLVHGDLHSGSIMVTDDDTRVIDPEFAFYGPMAFDVGMLLANFWMAYLLAARPREGRRPRRACAPICSASIVETWSVFRAEFSHLWRTERTGMLYRPPPVRGSRRSARRRAGARPRAARHLGRHAGLCRRRDATAASSASPTMPISRRSPTRICALAARRKALKFGRHICVNRHHIHSLDEINALAVWIEKGTVVLKVGDRHYRTIWLNADGRSVDIIDQRWLPHDFRVETVGTVDGIATAIRDMWVRGAPLIGVTAAYGVAIQMRDDASDAALDEVWHTLHETRPTAINLRWALDAMRRVLTPLPAAERAAAAYAPRRRDRRRGRRAQPPHRQARAGDHPQDRRAARSPASRSTSSPTAMPAGWRPSTTAPRPRRSIWRPRPAFRSTSMSTRRGRATRAPSSPPGRWPATACRTR